MSFGHVWFIVLWGHLGFPSVHLRSRFAYESLGMRTMTYKFCDDVSDDSRVSLKLGFFDIV